MAIDRKWAIIEAATASFASFGYKATTIDQVAKMANVGKGTIYTFFKNKEELLDEIVTRLISEMKEAAEAAIREDDTFIENVLRALSSILTFRKDHKLAWKLFQEDRDIGTPAVQEVLLKMDRAILSFIRYHLELAIQKGEIRECDPEITAFVMRRLYIALISDWEQHHEPLGEKQIAELFELYLLKGLSK
ncbi:TetR/AcrR family transcriptional regulator [Ectobacillus funiculus]|uniref:TetR/AcrR family transcriptional regulator n=1 Tax=Ectobacillus funiculus TaxID=137993 RepID=A0ABV5WL85_9BACI